MSTLTRTLSQLKASSLAPFRGFVPFYKESNISYTHIRDWLHLHLEDELRAPARNHGILTRVAKCPDFFASGICFLLIGGSNILKNDKYFQEINAVHVVKLRLGAWTNTGVLIKGTNSKIIREHEIVHSHDDLFFIIKRKIDYQNFLIYQEFDRLRYHHYEKVIDRSLKWGDALDQTFDHHDDRDKHADPDSYDYNYHQSHVPDQDIFTVVSCGDCLNTGEERMTTSILAELPVRVEFKQVTIEQFSPQKDSKPAEIILKIESNARFNARCIPILLKKFANIDSCVLSCDRIAFGPVVKEDCLRKHQMYMSEMQASAEAWTDEIREYILPYKLKDEGKVKVLRSRFL